MDFFRYEDSAHSFDECMNVQCIDSMSVLIICLCKCKRSGRYPGRMAQGLRLEAVRQYCQTCTKHFSTDAPACCLWCAIQLVFFFADRQL